ncbi:MAG: 50S ribosomal protein L11 methyltransferase [Vicinamibacterales bacterium]|nr:50S ribosomal protein L11 methyltransferase [Vicinamibacterales bacterium]MDP7472767.1 50S ribosomal protein L11 methyltransferase [Vicinamibacterales bacterium]MDP7672830.1 50S ribosomal protein L11 methyltransferase [Vicinamibacterales bacterium]HJO38906.1 50S ribosomal protein L11 methyltransferase [Vicinamibacterales bacterium]
MDLTLALLDDFRPTGLDTSDNPWQVYFATTEACDGARLAIVDQLAGLGVSAEAVDLPDEHWAERSQAALRAVRVGRLVIAPPWDAPAGPGADTIVITPSFAFGTAHHASTRLCLQALQRVPVEGRRVLDVGTGSGVLAIAASRLGAAGVVGIESDRMAVDAARRNVSDNPGARVEIVCADAVETAMPTADIVLANLTGATVMAMADILADTVGGGGHVIVGGCTRDEEPALDAALGTRLIRDRTDDEAGWIAQTWRPR